MLNRNQNIINLRSNVRVSTHKRVLSMQIFSFLRILMNDSSKIASLLPLFQHLCIYSAYLPIDDLEFGRFCLFILFSILNDERIMKLQRINTEKTLTRKNIFSIFLCASFANDIFPTR